MIILSMCSTIFWPYSILHDSLQEYPFTVSGYMRENIQQTLPEGISVLISNIPFSIFFLVISPGSRSIELLVTRLKIKGPRNISTNMKLNEHLTQLEDAYFDTIESRKALLPFVKKEMEI